MLLNFHDKSRMPIKYLWQLIFNFTFDKKSCGHMTKDIIGQQLVKWNGFIKINKAYELEKYGLDPQAEATPVGQRGSVLDEMEYQLQLMCSWVVREEKGEFERKIELYKKHKIDYRLAEPCCHVFPEYQSKRNFKKGQEALKVNMKDKPEQYSNPNKRKQYFIGRDV